MSATSERYGTPLGRVAGAYLRSAGATSETLTYKVAAGTEHPRRAVPSQYSVRMDGLRDIKPRLVNISGVATRAHALQRRGEGTGRDRA